MSLGAGRGTGRSGAPLQAEAAFDEVDGMSGYADGLVYSKVKSKMRRKQLKDCKHTTLLTAAVVFADSWSRTHGHAWNRIFLLETQNQLEDFVLAE